MAVHIAAVDLNCLGVVVAAVVAADVVVVVVAAVVRDLCLSLRCLYGFMFSSTGHFLKQQMQK